MVIHWPGKFEVQEGMGCPGPPDRGVEVQNRVDMAMGTIFCGEFVNGIVTGGVTSPLILGQVISVTAIILSECSYPSPSRAPLILSS